MHTKCPTAGSDEEAEYPSRVAARDEDREPRDHYKDHGHHAEEGQDDVVRIARNHLTSGSQRLRSWPASG